jgi:hypothetical protein
VLLRHQTFDPAWDEVRNDPRFQKLATAQP